MRNHTPGSRKLRARALRHFPAAIACAALSACASLPASRSASGASRASAAFDVVIRNGRVLDGAGNPWILADVAIKDGRFARIGVVRERGTKEIDARGKYVSPGW